MTAIHVSIPVRVLEDFDATLRFNQSRSASITKLILSAAGGVGEVDLYEATDSQIIRHLVTREVIDDTLAHLLLQVLTK